MSTYTQILYHIVYGTKNRLPVLAAPHRRELFAYKYGIIRNLNCTLLRMNGVEDHIHMLVDLHPTVSLSMFIQKTQDGLQHLDEGIRLLSGI